MQQQLGQLQLQVSPSLAPTPAASSSSNLLGSELPSPIAAQNQYFKVDPFMTAPKRRPGLQWNKPEVTDEFLIGTPPQKTQLDELNFQKEKFKKIAQQQIPRQQNRNYASPAGGKYLGLFGLISEVLLPMRSATRASSKILQHVWPAFGASPALPAAKNGTGNPAAYQSPFGEPPRTTQRPKPDMPESMFLDLEAGDEMLDEGQNAEEYSDSENEEEQYDYDGADFGYGFG